jgi:chromate reductase
VGAHGLLADEQGLGDPPVGEAPGQELEYLTFALREAGRGRGAVGSRAAGARRRARGGSTDTAARATARSGAPGQVTTVPYEGLAGLPAFNPDHDGERVPEAVAQLRREIAAADAVPFCTPEYAGSLPPSLKNLRLDGGGGEMYGKPVAWISVAAEGRGMGAQDALASVPGYLGATVIETARRRSACAALARTGSCPSGSAAPLIATAVCEALCGSIPIITPAMNGSSSRMPW